MTEEGSVTVGNSDGQIKKKKKTWNPSICKNASILALRREKQAKLSLGWSQHGEKSLKFHSINSIVEYVKRSIFLKQKYINPLLSSSGDSIVCLCCNPLLIHPHKSGCGSMKEQTEEENGNSFLHLLRSFFSLSWSNEDVVVHTFILYK